jgi:hypothetical protein
MFMGLLLMLHTEWTSGIHTKVYSNSLNDKSIIGILLINTNFVIISEILGT